MPAASEAHEESEMVAEFSRMFRTGAMGVMQLSEARQRRQQNQQRMDQAQGEAGRERERAVASTVTSRINSRSFWTTAGNRNIADTVFTAQQLGAGGNVQANSAYMLAADTIRDRWGVNVETAGANAAGPQERHASLLRMLDDHNHAGRQRDEVLDREVQQQRDRDYSNRLSEAASPEAAQAGLSTEAYLSQLSQTERQAVLDEHGTDDTEARDERIANAVERDAEARLTSAETATASAEAASTQAAEAAEAVAAATPNERALRLAELDQTERLPHTGDPIANFENAEATEKARLLERQQLSDPVAAAERLQEIDAAFDENTAPQAIHDERQRLNQTLAETGTPAFAAQDGPGFHPSGDAERHERGTQGHQSQADRHQAPDVSAARQWYEANKEGTQAAQERANGKSSVSSFGQVVARGLDADDPVQRQATEEWLVRAHQDVEAGRRHLMTDQDQQEAQQAARDARSFESGTLFSDTTTKAVQPEGRQKSALNQHAAYDRNGVVVEPGLQSHERDWAAEQAMSSVTDTSQLALADRDAASVTARSEYSDRLMHLAQPEADRAGLSAHAYLDALEPQQHEQMIRHYMYGDQFRRGYDNLERLTEQRVNYAQARAEANPEQLREAAADSQLVRELSAERDARDETQAEAVEHAPHQEQQDAQEAEQHEHERSEHAEDNVALAHAQAEDQYTAENSEIADHDSPSAEVSTEHEAEMRRHLNDVVATDPQAAEARRVSADTMPNGGRDHARRSMDSSRSTPKKARNVQRQSGREHVRTR